MAISPFPTTNSTLFNHSLSWLEATFTIQVEAASTYHFRVQLIKLVNTVSKPYLLDNLKFDFHQKLFLKRGSRITYDFSDYFHVFFSFSSYYVSSYFELEYYNGCMTRSCPVLQRQTSKITPRWRFVTSKLRFFSHRGTIDCYTVSSRR